MAAIHHVAILIETSTSYGRGILRGAAKFNREHARWSPYFHPFHIRDPLPSWVKEWKGDGILARIENQEMADFVLKLNVPVVNLLSVVPNLPHPSVSPDHREIARLAADHLLERGIKHFGFFGRARGIHLGLDDRCDCFVEQITRAGWKCDVNLSLDSRIEQNWNDTQNLLARWIAHLPKPVGIMAANDEWGLRVIDACRRCGAGVPDEVAVIGVDNDESMCELTVPPLSSIDANSEQIGYVASELLEQMMQGKKTYPMMQKVTPRGVIVRRSSDMLASEDHQVNQALRFIRENGCKGIDVGDVLQHVGISRTLMQQRLKRVTGRTIRQEIERVRLQRAKVLLTISDMSIKQIAKETGFSSAQYLTRVFREEVHETPARYRRHRTV